MREEVLRIASIAVMAFLIIALWTLASARAASGQAAKVGLPEISLQSLEVANV